MGGKTCGNTASYISKEILSLPSVSWDEKKWPQIRYARKFGYGAGFVAADSEAINSLQSSETYQCSQ